MAEAPTDALVAGYQNPDPGPALASYDDDELVELFDAFNLEARYNHIEKTLALSVSCLPRVGRDPGEPTTGRRG